MGYYSGAKELVPVGWNSVDEERDFPRLSTRDPQIRKSIEAEDLSNEYAMPNAHDTSDESSTASDEDSPQLLSNANTRMNEESSEEDEELPAINKPVVRTIF